MSTHTVTVTLDVEITNPAVLRAIPGVSGDGERSQLQSALDVGLRELEQLTGRYGMKVSNATATVA